MNPNKSELEKIKDEFHEMLLSEMSNLRKRITGLPVNLSLQIETDEDKKYKHNIPRLKFQNNTSDRITGISDLIPVSIEDESKVLVDRTFDYQIFEEVREFIIKNKEALLQFWNQEIDEYELRDLLK